MRCRLRPRREVLVERGKTSARLRITSPWPLLFLADVDLKVNSDAGELGVWRSFWGGDQGLLGNVFWKDSRISDTEGLDSRSGWSSMHFVVPRINSGQVATPNPYYIVNSLLGSGESRMCRDLLAVDDDLQFFHSPS